MVESVSVRWANGDPRVRGVLDFAPVGIYLADGQGAWTYANTRACELIGQPSAMVLGSGWARWLHADDAPWVCESWARAVRERSPFRAEYRFVKPCGTAVQVLGRAVVVETEGSAATSGYLGVLTDITATRASESRLAETLRHLQAVYRASPDMIFLHGPDGELMDVNDKVLECYGYTRQEMLTLPFAEFSGGCCSAQEAFHLLARARAGEELDFEWCARRRNGEEFPVEVRLRRLGDGSTEKAASVVAVVRDITAAKRAQEELSRTRDRLRQLLSRDHGRMERERTAIAGEIHDEFGSLLMALKMNLHAISSTILPSAPELGDRFEIMNGLIDDAVTTIRRIATELRPRILDDFGLVAALEWHIKEFERHAGIGCELTTDMEECDPPPDVATALFRILQESLTNVARHAGAQRVQIHVGRDNGDIVLMVRDDGRGVDVEAISSHQAQGIFGMRERALHHGGTFEIQGAPGKGTVVAVRVPIKPPVACS